MSYQVVVDNNIVSFVIVLYNMCIYIYMIIMTYIHVIIKILILLEMKSNSMPNIFFFGLIIFHWNSLSTYQKQGCFFS